MSVEPAQHIISVRAYVHCTDGYGGSVTRLILEPLARRLTHIVVQDDTVPAVEHLQEAKERLQRALSHRKGSSSHA